MERLCSQGCALPHNPGLVNESPTINSVTAETRRARREKPFSVSSVSPWLKSLLTSYSISP